MSRIKFRDSHIFVPELDCAQGLNFKVEAIDLLVDIKALLKEYYIATFNKNGNSLNITFNNGQKFRLTVKEVT